MNDHVNQTGEAVRSRPVREDDYDLILNLLLETQSFAPLGLNWDLRRFEGKRWYDPSPKGDPDWHKNSRLWETGEGQLVGLAHPDGWGYPYLQIHPHYRHIQTEMITWAEEHLADPSADGRIEFFIYEYDIHRRRILQDRGYQKMDYGGVIYHMRFGRQPLAQTKLPPGYKLRTTNPEDDHDAEQIADLLNTAFNRTFHTALEYQQFTRNASCFVPDLDLAAVTPDGRFAAYVGIPFDQYNRRGIFEPVCTHPDHRQKGLAKALMQEGLHRLKAYGAINVVVETGDMVPANRLYTSLGFTEMYKGYYYCLPNGRSGNL